MDYNKDYLDLTQSSTINTYHKQKYFNTRILVINLLLFTTLALGVYVGFYYCQSEQNNQPYKTKVMGVSEVFYSENELSSYQKQIQFKPVNIPMEINPIVEDDTLYTEVITEELDKGLMHLERIIEVQKGDTVESLAKEFYGDVKAVDKIVRANSDITDPMQTIYIGQKISLPY